MGGTPEGQQQEASREEEPKNTKGKVSMDCLGGVRWGAQDHHFSRWQAAVPSNDLTQMDENGE